MCGIFAIVGKRNTLDILNSLRKLEYRGYDSCGLLYVYHNRCIMTKTIGGISNLKDKITLCNVDCAIGHTRWATHGFTTVLNAHPQTTENNRFYVVHNGMIDNYQEIISKYGFVLRSQTDTEVIAHMLDYYIKNNTLLESIIKIKNEIKGNYAIVLIDRLENNRIYFLKNKSPLLIGADGKCFMISSDQCAFNANMNVTILNDGNYGYIDNDNYKIFTDNDNEYWNTFYKSNETKLFEANGDFMMSEIRFEPELINNIYNRYKTIDLSKFRALIDSCDEIVFVGAGSSHYASSILKIMFESKYNKRCHSIVASELSSFNILNKKILYIFLSQSGETADLCEHLEHIKENMGIIISLCNNINSTLGYRSDLIFPLFANEEISVASTKAFMGMIYVGSILSSYKIADPNLISISLKNTLKLEDKIKRIAYDLANSKVVFYIGKGLDYHIAQEGALKLREISYLPAFSFQAGELKHGSIALIDNDSVAILLSSDKSNYQALINCKEEIKSRSGNVYLITTYENNSDIYVNATFLNLILIIQLLAYHTAVLLERNVDRPRNLAKSVTVL